MSRLKTEKDTTAFSSGDTEPSIPSKALEDLLQNIE